jgi:hypothetical protein
MISAFRFSDFQISGSAISSHKNIHYSRGIMIYNTDILFMMFSPNVVNSETCDTQIFYHFIIKVAIYTKRDILLGKCLAAPRGEDDN